MYRDTGCKLCLFAGHSGCLTQLKWEVNNNKKVSISVSLMKEY